MYYLVGTHRRHIAKRELATLPQELHYACQPKAWFDEDIMLKGVQTILAPYVAAAPPNVIPILLLDLFKVHMKASVMTAIQHLGIQVEFIPPGCTGLLQPVSVGYSKAFKAKLRMEYNDWLMAQDADKPIPGTTHRKVANWINAGECNISNNTLENVWKKTGYSYFGYIAEDGVFAGEGAIVRDK